jgi:hypothetical protein
MEGSRVFSLSKGLNKIFSFWLGKSVPRFNIGFLALDTVDLGETSKRLFEVESRVAHQHVGESDELVKVVAVVSGRSLAVLTVESG